MEMTEYTQKLSDDLWSFEGLGDEDETPEKLLAYLNSPTFRSFGDGLSALIKTKLAGHGSVTPIEYIKHCCQKKHITIASRNTLTNWFLNGVRPKKSTESREMMFAIAFALELSIEETKALFQKVYLDRAINERDYKELIYYHCLKSKKTFQHAKNLIDRVKWDEPAKESTIRTRFIADATDSMEDDDLLTYIAEHPHNFQIRNTAAKQAVAKYISRATSYAQEEANRNPEDETLHGKNRTSINFVYERITNTRVSEKTGTKTIFKNAELPKEIKTNFPQPVVFSKEDPSFEELRKMIIFLFSYCSWHEYETQLAMIDVSEYFDFCEEQSNQSLENCASPMIKIDASTLFDCYEDQLNRLLAGCGLPSLYYGNPFDWLFMYCTLQPTPLDTFRGVLAEALSLAD